MVQLSASFTNSIGSEPGLESLIPSICLASTEISYSTQQAALTAALQAGASIVQQSLMNFLGTTG